MDLMTRLRSQWDQSLAVGTGVAGGVVLILGWLGVSGTAYPAEQLPYIISGGIGGLFLLGVSTALWLSADLHDEWRKLDRIEHAIRDAAAVQIPAGRVQTADGEPVTQRLPEMAAKGR